MQECWSKSPNKRPSVDQVAEILGGIPLAKLTGDLQVHLERKQDMGVDAPDALNPLSFRAAMRGQDTNFSKAEIVLMRDVSGRR